MIFQKARQALSNAGTGQTLMLSGGLMAGAYTLNKLFTPINAYGTEKGQMTTGNSLADFALNMESIPSGNYLPGVNANTLAGAAYEGIGRASREGVLDIFGKSAMYGAAAMGVAGAVTGSLIGRRGNAMSRITNMMAGGAIGASTGAYLSAKMVNGVSQIASTFHRNIRGLSKPMEDRRAFGSGAGHRSWAKPAQGRMPVGHLGATGDLVLSMHKVRNQAVI